MALTRRGLLRGALALGGGALLAACADSGEPSPDTSPTAAAGDPREDIRTQLGIEAPLDLSIIVPAPLLIAGQQERLVFGLGTSPTDFRAGLSPRVWLVRDEGLEQVAGPLEATFHDEGLEGLGVYLVETQVEQPGTYWIAVDAGESAAVGAAQFLPPGTVRVPEVGQPFPSVPTPTNEDPRGLEDICTDEPPCSMHDVSLQQAMEAGRPVVLTVATPAFCQTVICGPVVDIIEQVKQSTGRDDIAWIHSEVYADAGNTPVPLISELQLPSEPWTFFVGADGTLVDRLQGPTPADLVRTAVEKL